MKYVLMLVSLLLISTADAAMVRDTVCVNGQVVDSLTGAPLKDAMVKLSQRTGGGGGGGGTIETVVLDSMHTDAQGAFDFGRFLPAGRITVIADLLGYQDDTQTVEADSTSDTVSVRFALYPDSTDILVPELIAVADGYDARPTLAWHPVDSAESYLVQIDTLPNFSNPMISAPTADTSYATLIDLPQGTIYWRVGSSLNMAVFSDRSEFEILNDEIPQLIAYTSDSTDEVRPMLVWHTVDGASAYTIQIDESAGFGDPIVTVPTSDTSYAPLVDLPAGDIYWRVKSDLNDTYSPAGQLHIIDQTIVQLIAYEPDPTQETRPTLAWHPVGGATEYRIQINNQQNFSRPDIDTSVADTSFAPNADLADGNVFWRVMADNGTVYSDVDNFYILSDDVPLQVMFDGDTLDTFRPTFVWHPLDSATYYQIEISDDNMFTTTIVSTPTSDTSYTPLINLPAGMLFWRVSCDLDLVRFSPKDRVFLTEPVDIGTRDIRMPAVQGAVSSNPFTEKVTLHVQLGDRNGAIFTVTTPAGQVLYNMPCAEQGPGDASFTWNAAGMDAGTYILSVTTGTEMYLHRVMLAR